jgi:hypothetical protein
MGSNPVSKTIRTIWRRISKNPSPRLEEKKVKKS